MSVHVKVGGVWEEVAPDPQAFVEGIPVGAIVPFSGTVAPNGYLFCNGAAVSRTAYSDLYAVLGTSFGEGDGSTTFNLPDIRGRFLRGQDEGQGIDPDAATRTALAAGGNTGDNIGSEQLDAMQRITGTVRWDCYMLDLSGVFTNDGGASGGGTAGSYDGRAKFDSADSTSPNTAKTSDDETRPRNVYVRYIIKFGVPDTIGVVDTNLDQRVTDLESKDFWPTLHVEDQKTAGTHGGQFTSGDWRTRDLNTVVTNDIDGASLASNQFTLPAGTYEIYVRAPAMYVDTHQARLYNVSDSAETLAGGGMWAKDTYGCNDSIIMGRFTITGTKTFEIQHQCNTTRATYGFGYAGNYAGNEVYTQVQIKKIA